MPRGGIAPESRSKRLLWFAALWMVGVLAVAAVAYAVRLVIGS